MTNKLKLFLFFLFMMDVNFFEIRVVLIFFFFSIFLAYLNIATNILPSNFCLQWLPYESMLYFEHYYLDDHVLAKGLFGLSILQQAICPPSPRPFTLSTLIRTKNYYFFSLLLFKHFVIWIKERNLNIRADVIYGWKDK